MIKIGEEIKPKDDYLYDEDNQPIKGATRDLKIKPVYISPEKEKKILESYEEVVVQEFGDEYHLPEEELKRRNMYYDAFVEIIHMRNKFRRLDKYVEAMRKVLKCLDVVAENNGVYDPDTFRERWAQGKIKVYGLEIPKYIGRDKKRISWPYVTEFILSDKDPSEIMKKEVEHLDNEEIEEVKEELFDPGQLERMTAPETDEEKEENRRLFSTRQSENIIRPLSREEMKLLSKDNPAIILNMKEIRKREKQSFIAQHAYVSDMTYSDMESINRYDQQHGFFDKEEEPKFTGSILNKKDVDKYVFALDNYYNHHTKEVYDGKLMTPNEIKSMKLKESLQADGWNVRKLFGNKEKLKRIKEAEKMDQKKRKQLKKRLIKMNQRREEREEQYRSLSARKISGGKKKKKKKK